jgi:Flp pilus assembly protein TadG
MICHPERSEELRICRLYNMKRVARKLRTIDGAEIAEAALVLPLVFMLILGVVWFGRAFNIYSTIQQAAQQGAILAARSTCGTCNNTQSSDTAVSTAVGAVMQASSLDPTQIPVNTNAPSPYSCVSPAVKLTCPPPTNNITICRQALLNSPITANQTPQCGTIVSFQYPFQFYLPFTSLNMQKITLTAQAQSRMEN